jgi:hypothetical protein
MTLADDAKAGPPPAEKRRTRLEVWLDSLDSAERAGAEAILDSDTWSHRDVAARFKRYGFTATPQQIGAGRKVREDDAR